MPFATFWKWNSCWLRVRVCYVSRVAAVVDVVAVVLAVVAAIVVGL